MIFYTIKQHFWPMIYPRKLLQRCLSARNIYKIYNNSFSFNFPFIFNNLKLAKNIHLICCNVIKTDNKPTRQGGCRKLAYRVVFIYGMPTPSAECQHPEAWPASTFERGGISEWNLHFNKKKGWNVVLYKELQTKVKLWPSFCSNLSKCCTWENRSRTVTWICWN